MTTHSNFFKSNTDLIQRRSEFCGRIQLVMLGVALMLMMMDLSKPYFLAPCLLILALCYVAQKKADNLNEQFDEAKVTLSPKTLLIETELEPKQQRIHYTDIKSVTEISLWGFKGIEIVTRTSSPMQLFGFNPVLTKAINERLS